jgi:glycosyltransferase involved in cell wall biosynthesis
MKVLFLSSGIPSSSDFSSGIFERNQVKVLSECYNIVHCVLNFGRPILNYEELPNVTTLVINLPIRVFPNEFWCKIVFIGFIKNKLKKYKFDNIHAHNFDIGYFGMLISKYYGIKALHITEHSSKVHNKNLTKKELRLLLGAYNFKNTKLLAVSNSLAKSMCNFSSKKIVVLGNVVLFRSRESFSKYEGGIAKFVFIGAFIPIKNIFILLESFVLLLKDLRAELHVYGDGSLRKEIEAFILVHNLSRYVFLHGEVANSVLLESLPRYHFGIISSLSETFNVSGIEFLINGLPVVTTPCGGPQDYINSNNGVISEDFSASSLASAAKKLVLNEYFNRRLISDEIFAKYGPIGFIKSVQNIYK